MERYDPKNNQWSSVSSMNDLRDGASVVADDSNIFAVSGFDGNSYLSTMEVYDPSKNKWSNEGLSAKYISYNSRYRFVDFFYASY